MKKEEKDNVSKIVKNLKEATKNINSSSKEYADKLNTANEAFETAIENTPSKDKQQVANVVIRANALLRKLKEGGNKEEIIKQLKSLKIK